ncbi:protein of unknown function [uncultured Sphingopyxis sp.]|uniref:Uncharacterized protein n=1 Tax=uncultured Sphingopyxis sp. TaxID=310581 RepID=A0A1Y5PRU2_9SPHN|nr:protein of unknown function [uncultured Sphingopyxis sp.]
MPRWVAGMQPEQTSQGTQLHGAFFECHRYGVILTAAWASIRPAVLIRCTIWFSLLAAMERWAEVSYCQFGCDRGPLWMINKR